MDQLRHPPARQEVRQEMSLPKITRLPNRVIETEEGPIQSDFRGTTRVRRLTYEDGTCALFVRDVRIVDLQYAGSIYECLGTGEPTSYVYHLIGEDGNYYSTHVDHGSAMWLINSLPRRTRR